MSHKCRLRSYKNIGEDGKWAADRIETLERQIDKNNPILDEAAKHIEELEAALSECQKDRDYYKANDRCAMSYLAEVRSIVGWDDFPDMVKRVTELKRELSEVRGAAMSMAMEATPLAELNVRIDDRNAALLSKTVELSECQKQRDELLGDIAEESVVREKLATLLAETAVALKGPEAALFRHSWHDLADVAAGIVKQRDELLAALEPFATAYEPVAEQIRKYGANPEMLTFLDRNAITPATTVGHFRRAFEAIASVKEKP